MTDSSVLTDSPADALPASSGLQLDKRQRAMLREMGIRVWLPVHAPVAAVPELPAEVAHEMPQQVSIAANSVAADARDASATPHLESRNEPEPASAPAPARATRPQLTPAAVSEPQPQAAATGEASWQLGQAQLLYADSGPKDSGARWLVLIEAPVAALHNPAFNPFEGDVGKLLDNMLRATRLHKAAAVLLAPLVRQLGSG
ncbi:MAG: hypothetical protein V4772_10790, partial [Pseudomonadota bacterium]